MESSLKLFRNIRAKSEDAATPTSMSAHRARASSRYSPDVGGATPLSPANAKPLLRNIRAKSEDTATSTSASAYRARVSSRQVSKSPNVGGATPLSPANAKPKRRATPVSVSTHEQLLSSLASSMESIKTDLNSQRQALLHVKQQQQVANVGVGRKSFVDNVVAGTTGLTIPDISAIFDGRDERNVDFQRQAGVEESADRERGSSLTALGIGDIVSLSLSDVGLLVGDACLNRLGVEQAVPAAGVGNSGSGFTQAAGAGRLPGRFPGAAGVGGDACAFRLCPKLNYRAQREMERLEFSRKGHKDGQGELSGGGGTTTHSRLQERLEHERAQNEELLTLVRSKGKTMPLVFGDIVQLEHIRSRRFVEMTNSPATLNMNNHVVSFAPLSQGSTRCHFRVAPRFKVRSLGSKVFADDEVVLESVKFEGFVLSASTEHAFAKASACKDSLVPRLLRNPRTLELSGWLLRRGNDGKPVTHLDHGGGGDKGVDRGADRSADKASEGKGQGSNTTTTREEHRRVSSFQLRLFARFLAGDTTDSLTSFNKVRLFDPELNGYMCASSDRDKGEVLDALPWEVSSGAASRARFGGCPAHVAYLKPFAPTNTDPINSLNLSAKSVWRFEPVGELAASVVSFNQPVRVRHVTTNLFLAVDLSRPGVKVTVAKSCLSSGSNSFDKQPSEGRAGLSGPSSSDPLFFDCFLTDGKARTFDNHVLEEEDQDQEKEAGGGNFPTTKAAAAAAAVREGFFHFPSARAAAVMPPPPPEAMVFRLVPTDEKAAELKQGFTTVRIEHRTLDGEHLYLSDIDDVKPKFKPLHANSAAGDKGEASSGGDTHMAYNSAAHSAAAALPGEMVGQQQQQEAGPRCRIGFVGRATGLDALVVRPVSGAESEALEAVMDCLQSVSLYAHRYRTADLPLDACEELVGVLLNLLDLLQKGEPPPRKHKTIADHMHEANKMQAPHFSAMNFGGEVNPKIQTMCYQTKLLDALFDAALAPYNRQYFERGPDTPGPFESPVTSGQPAATQKFIYLSIQRICFGNETVMHYFARARARVWRQGVKARERESFTNLLVDQAEDGFGATVLLAQLFKSSSAILNELVSVDLMKRFQQLIKKCGPQVRLINLFASTCFVENRPMRGFQEACARTLWLNPVDRYNLGVTFHETTADAVVQAFRGKEPLHFPYGAPAEQQGHSSNSNNLVSKSQHPISTVERINSFRVNSKHGHPTQVNEDTHDRKFRGHVRYPPGLSAPENYLGKAENNVYPPVGVVWRSSRTLDWGSMQGEDDRGGLFWSPEHLHIPTLQEEVFYPPGPYKESGEYLGKLVPLELLAWVLEPERLCLAVTGKPFVPFASVQSARKSSMRRGSRISTSPTPMEKKSRRRQPVGNFSKQAAGNLSFDRKRELTAYIIAQVNLLTQMCRGRCMNAIILLEECFSYSLLLNMASNPWLPYRFRAVVVHLVLALYVDRFPQLPQCGSPQLPEIIWIFDEEKDEDSASTFGQTKKAMSVINPILTLQHEDAFPGFYLPFSCMAHGKANPVLSMPDHTKFYLLRTLCNDLRQLQGLVYDDDGFNALTAALLTGQAYLLNFGFQSTIEKIRDMCKPNSRILDGRGDQIQPGVLFNPPEQRFRDMGLQSEMVVSIKRSIIDEFFALADLRVNYRLALILGQFKRKLKQLRETTNTHHHSNFSSWMGGEMKAAGQAVILAGVTGRGGATKSVKSGEEIIAAWAGSFQVYAMFEGLFQEVLPSESNDDADDNGGSGVISLGMGKVSGVVGNGGLFSEHDSHNLQFAKLSEMPDFEDVLMDNLLYDNDYLMSASLHLLDTNYGMRQRLMNSLRDCVLLEDQSIAVFGKVQTLRSNINDLAELVLTHSNWCVNSVMSGQYFSEAKYGKLMSSVDSLIEFTFTPQLGQDVDPEDDPSSALSTQKTARASYGSSLCSADDGNDVISLGKTPKASPFDDLTQCLPVSPHSSKEPARTEQQKTQSSANKQERSENKKKESDQFAPVNGRPTEVFIAALTKHFCHTWELTAQTFFDKMVSTCVADGLLDLEEVTYGVRRLLNLSAVDLTDAEVAELFKVMSNGFETLNYTTFENFVMCNGDKERFSGRFTDCDRSADGTFYRVDKVWSVDVAGKWLDKTRPLSTRIATAPNASVEAVAAGEASPLVEGRASTKWHSVRCAEFSASGGRGVAATMGALKPNTFHQNILRGCNLQRVLHEAILIDPDIAFKGSQCTVGLKVESQRRLTLVTRALFMLYKAFVTENVENQEIMFKDMDELQRIATPPQLKSGITDIFDERSSGGRNGMQVEERHHECFCVTKDGEDAAAKDSITASGLHGMGTMNFNTSEGTGKTLDLENKHEVMNFVLTKGFKIESMRELALRVGLNAAYVAGATAQQLISAIQALYHTRELEASKLGRSAASRGKVKQRPPRPTNKQVDISEEKQQEETVLPSRAWPTTLEESAQDLILSVTRGNAALCSRLAENEVQRDSLFDLFAFVANEHGQVQQRQEQRKAENEEEEAMALKKRRVCVGKAEQGCHNELILLTSSDTSPALEFFFIMCAPTPLRSLPDSQIQVAERLCDFSRYDALARSCASCVRRVRNRAMNEILERPPLPAQEAVENPFRMVCLLKACCQGGNDKVATLIASSAMLGVGECCHALLAHCQMPHHKDSSFDLPSPLTSSTHETECIMDGEEILRILSPPSRILVHIGEKNSGKSNSVGHSAAETEMDKISGEASKHAFGAKLPSLNLFNTGGINGSSSQAAAVAVISEEEQQEVVGAAALTSGHDDSGGSLLERGAFEVLALLVELVDLLPLSASQLRSPLLWEVVHTVCLPATNALATREEDHSFKGVSSHVEGERLVCAEIADLLDRLLTRIDHHNLVEELLAEQFRVGEPLVDDILDDFKDIVSHPNSSQLVSSRTGEALERFFLRCEGQAITVPKFSRKDSHVYYKKVKQPRQNDHGQSGGGVGVDSSLDEEAWSHRYRRNVQEERRQMSFSKLPSAPSAPDSSSMSSIFDKKGAGEKQPRLEKELSLDSSFQVFREALTENPHVKMAILRRRFALLTLLERGTQPKPPTPPQGTTSTPATVAVTWEMLVARFVRYARELGRFDADKDPSDHSGAETCFLIFRLLRDHLVKARTLPLDRLGNPVVASTAKHCHAAGTQKDLQTGVSGSNNNSNSQQQQQQQQQGPEICSMEYDHPRVVELRTVPACLLSAKSHAAFVAKQHMLTRLGCVEVCARVMMGSNEKSSDGDLADEALEVLDELNHGGDVKVRKCLFDLITTEDKEGRFLAHLAVRMENANTTLEELREGRVASSQGGGGGGLSVGEEEEALAIADARRTVQFLSHLCLGHDANFQNILREQPMYNASTFDLVGMCLDLLCSLAEESHQQSSGAKCMPADQLELMRDLLDFTCRVQEGPNQENQLKVARSDLLMALNLILAADSPTQEASSSDDDTGGGGGGVGRISLDALCFQVLCACVEGRQDEECHDLLRQQIEMTVVYEKARLLDRKCCVAVKRHVSSHHAGLEVAQLNLNLGALANAWTVHSELFPQMSVHRSRWRLMWRTISYKGDDDEEEEEDSDGDGDDGDDDSGGDDTSAAAGKEGEVAMTERRVMDASIDNAPPPPPHAFLRAPSLAKTPPSSIPPEARNKTPTDSLSAGGRRRHGSFLATLIETDKNTSKNHTRDDKKEDVGDDRDEALSSDSEDDESRFNGSDGGGEDEGGARSNGRQRRDDLARSLAKRRRLVGSVEVMWRGKVQRVCFPMPRQAHTLTAKTKRTFLDKTRLGTTSKRLELLFGSTDLFIAEMNWVHKISEESKLYRWIGTHLDSLRTLMYSLVVLLNVNVLLSPPSLSKPFKSLFGPGNYAALQSNERVSLALTFVLGGINFAGYFVIMGYVALTTVPVMICETDKFIERQRRALEASEWTNIGAFKWWFVTLVFNVMFIFMHTTNFPEYTDQSTGLYVFLIFGINLPWTLSCVRNYVVVPQSPNQRRFMIAYDTIVTKPFLRNHLLLQFLSVQGFISSEYFTLMLFDILNNSQKLANVVQAICVHGDSLVLVFLLFLATTLSYASFGVEHFPGDFTTSYQGTTKTFKTVLSAFLFLFYNQQRGVLKGSLLPPEPKSDNWLPRIAFDTAYFVWVGIILFTTITALLVDALSKARTEAALREAEEHNVCFMCGLKRAHYNDCSDQVAADSPSFDEHCDEVHDPWAYVAYCAYLQRRKRQDCTGLEAYVKKLLANNSTAWVPSRTTFVLEEKASQQGQAVSSGNEVPAAAPSSDGGDTGGSGGGGGAGGASNGVPPPTPKSPHAGGANKSVPSSPSGV